jgi:murein DD-endopeptidase MepM/ murein hydrolase activator NlpD
MRSHAEPVRSSSWTRLAVMAALAASTAACSSEVNRFNDNSTFSNPFSTSSRNQPPPQQPAPGYAQGPSRVESQPLPPQGGYQQGYPQQGGYQQQQPQPQYQQPNYQQQSYNQPLPPPPQNYANAPQSRPASTNPRVASAGRVNNASYGDVTGSVSRPAPAGGKGWSWEGGTAITVARGDTIMSLSRRYGVPAPAIEQANGLTPHAPLKPGQRLVIPKYSATTSSAAAQPQPLPQQQADPVTTGSTGNTRGGAGQFVHVINPGETLMALSRKYNKSLSEIARANNLPINHRVAVGERIVIPGLRANNTQMAAAAPRPAVTAPQAQPVSAQQQRVVAAEPQMQNSARVVTPAAGNPEPAKAVDADEPTGATGFRWPVRGRVIAGFGPKPTGQQNDGINLAVPEGTPVKAADDGTVAYAGNELKGYGNLVLIRHANGFVTAYAHASELMVKRGDTVKRGQVIAKSGQTGNVTSPQLHFEVRKGATPVDPMQHLAGAS